MNHTQQIIQDAIEGGWDNKGYDAGRISNSEFVVAKALLDPLFWQAVGKTRGWFEGEECDEFNRCVRADEWLKKWHTFIDHLAEGDDYETALSKLV